MTAETTDAGLSAPAGTTPGPWERCGVFVQSTDDHRTIARAWRDDDAALCAAAPDLFAACALALEYVEATGRGGIGGIIRAALAKAEGREATT